MSTVLDKQQNMISDIMSDIQSLKNSVETMKQKKEEDPPKKRGEPLFPSREVGSTASAFDSDEENKKIRERDPVPLSITHRVCLVSPFFPPFFNFFII